MMNKTICCFIGRNKQECKKEAEFTILYGNEATESCASHIGELMDDAISRFEVLRIDKGEECSICHGQGSTTDHHDPCTECGGSGRLR